MSIYDKHKWFIINQSICCTGYWCHGKVHGGIPISEVFSPKLHGPDVCFSASTKSSYPGFQAHGNEFRCKSTLVKIYNIYMILILVLKCIGYSNKSLVLENNLKWKTAWSWFILKHLILWFLVTRWEVPWYNSMRIQRHLHKNASQHIWCSWGTLRLQTRCWGSLRVSKTSRLRALSPPISPTYWNQKIQTWARMYTNISNTKCVY